MLLKQRQEIIEAHESEDARLEALRVEKEEIERQIAQLLEQERLEEEKERQEEQRKRQEQEQARLQQEMMDELAKHLNTIAIAKIQDDENVSEYIPEDLVRSLDYGNVTQNYSLIRSRIRDRICAK
jgi:hypothetical protein